MSRTERDVVAVPGKSASVFRIISRLLFAAFAVLLAYAYYRSEIVYRGTMRDAYSIFYIIAIGGLVFWGVVLRLGDEARANIVIAMTSIVVGLYLVEVSLYFLGAAGVYKSERKIVAEQLGIAFDSRTKLQVIRDLRSRGEDAYPWVNISNLIGAGVLQSAADDGPVPLGGVAGKLTVHCNEGGEYAIYRADRYGFSNPDAEWDRESADWLITGDSYAHGACVKPELSIAGRMRSMTGESVINLGIGGNGPLVELAALTEYAGSRRPARVLWLYYEGNDLSKNLPREMKSPLLKRYLQPGYSQGLVRRQNEIDQMLGSYIAAAEKSAANEEITDVLYSTRLLRLHNVRRLIGMQEDVEVSPAFSRIMTQAKERVSAWGGELHFVYLPQFSRYALGVTDHDSYRNRRQVIETVEGLGIPVIDIHQAVFEHHPDPLSLFPLRMQGHYTAGGYQAVARAILEAAGGHGKAAEKESR